jgi:hypothetical protein
VLDERDDIEEYEPAQAAAGERFAAFVTALGVPCIQARSNNRETRAPTL